MAENKKGFVLYADLIHTVKQLPDDKAGMLLKHILSYVNDENPTTEDIIINIAFEPIKQQLKRDLVKYEDVKVKRSKAGKLGGRPKQKETKEANAFVDKQSKAKKAVTVKGNVIDKDTVIVTDSSIMLRGSGDISKHLQTYYSDEYNFNCLKEQCLYKGEFTDLNKLILKFSLQFTSRYGISKTTDEVIEIFKSWVYRDKPQKSDKEEILFNIDDELNK